MKNKSVDANNTVANDDEMKAFNADIALAEYHNRVITGTLSDEEKEDRDFMLGFLGVSEKDFK